MRTRNTPIIDIVTLVLGGLVALAGALAGVSQIMELHPAVPVILNGLVVGGGAVILYLRGEAQSQTVPKDDVLEALAPVGDDVIAGPANDRVYAGDVVRQIGATDQRHHVAD